MRTSVKGMHRCLLLAMCFVGSISAGLLSSAAQAQDSTTELGKVIVTGSAIPRTSKETASPVQIITRQEIERSGLTTTADVVRAVSADNSGTIPTAFGNGFAAGSAGVALRGLTVNSTLVLIDGRRAANYALADDGERGFVDLNTIPLNSIERIEVLKDGASSLYGADAIAGVVNIIMRHEFVGKELSGELGTSQHGGGTMRRLDGSIGTGTMSSNGHNAYLTFEYERDDRIAVGQRKFPYNTNNLSSIGGNNPINGPAGQPSSNFGSIVGSVTPGMLTIPGNVTSGVPLTGAVSQPLGPCVAPTFAATDASGNSYCAQDLSKYGDDQPAQERFGLNGRFTTKIDDDATAYLNASFYENKVVVDLNTAASQIQDATPNNTDGIALPATLPDGSLNPNDPFAAAGEVALINYNFNAVLPSVATYTNQNYRMVAGVKGTFADWNYDSAVVINHTSLLTQETGLINYTQLISDVVNGTYNFINPTMNSAATLSALSSPLIKTSTTDLDSIDFRVNRELMNLLGGPLGLAAGTEYRYEATRDPDLNPSLQYQGLGIAHTIGQHDVTALYTELDAPVLKTLDVDVAARYDHYTDFADHGITPKLGIKWTPIEQAALRGTYSEGFRAPSFSENGSSAAEGFVTYTPPTSFTMAHHSDGYTLPYNLAELSEANPAIGPEKARNFTLGGVFQPIKPLSISIDYYHIRKTNVIIQPNPAAALDAYFSGAPVPAGEIVLDNPDPAYPTLPARPIVTAGFYQNANSLTTQGFDVDLQGNFRPIAGVKVISEMNVTSISSFKLILPGGATQQYVGTEGPYNLSSGAGTPRIRGTFANTVIVGPATITGTLYYTSGYFMYGPDVAPATFCLSQNNDTGASVPANCRVDSFWDFDLTGNYKVTKNVDVFGDIANLFDVHPPLDPANYAGVNYNPTYSQAGIVGRFFKVGARVHF